MTDETLDEFLGVKPQPLWRRHLKWILAGLGAVLLIILLITVFGGSDEPEYATAPVERGRLVTTVSATGKLAPTNQVTVGSQLSGLIVRVLVDVNDRVAAGQPLAEIDPEQLDAQIRQGQAQLAANQAQVGQAQATLAQARAQLARLEEVFRLSNGRVPSRTELETGRADYRRAEAGLRAAQANVVASQATLSQSQTQRARAVIRSPVSGVVLARQVDPGQTVAASFNTPTLFVIAEDLSQMKLEVSIDEADVGAVKQGQRATFTVDAFAGKTFPATITRVDIGSNLSAQAATSSGTATTGSAGQVVSYAADLAVANPDLTLRPGMTATADIVTSQKSGALLVPNAALRFRPQREGAQQPGGIAGTLTARPGRRNRAERSVTTSRGAQQTVYVLTAEDKLEPVTITTGDSDGSRTEVLSGGLRPGMRVVTGQLASADDASGARGGGSRSGGQRRGGGAGGG